MDVVCIPDIYRIMSSSYHTIDTFATWSEDLEVHLNSTNIEFPDQKIKFIMKRLAEFKHNIALPKITTLFQVLADSVLNVVGSKETPVNTAKTSVAQIIANRKVTSKACSILPIQTFDEATINKCHKDSKELRKMIDNFKSAYEKLQKKQQVCWIANNKVTKYKLCLLTAKTSRSYMADELSQKQLDERDTAIDQLQDILHIKTQRSEDAGVKYRNLLNEVSDLREKIKKLEDKIVGDLMFGLTERIKSGLSSLKQIITTNSKYRSSDLSDNIGQVETGSKCLASSIIDTLSSTKYNIYNPKEFHEKNGLNVRLPNCFMEYTEKAQSESSGQIDDQNNNKKCEEWNLFSNNVYLKPENLKECPSMKVKDGMIIKQKVATETSDVVFCWYKVNHWQRKRWTFFRK